MSVSSSRDCETPYRFRLLQALSQTPPGRVIDRAIRKPEYGVLYLGIAFWIVAGTLGIGRPLFDILVAHA